MSEMDRTRPWSRRDRDLLGLGDSLEMTTVKRGRPISRLRRQIWTTNSTLLFAEFVFEYEEDR